MLDLDQYKEYFSIEDTAQRCEAVLINIEPEARKLMERFMQENEIIQQNPDAYSIKSYAVSLRTTIADMKNPKYAIQSESTIIGRRYFVAIESTDENKEMNRLTLEFNDVDHTWRLYMDMRFNIIWLANSEKKLTEWKTILPEYINLYQKANDSSWSKINRDSLEGEVRKIIKSKKRPTFSIGESYPLEGQLNDNEIVERAHELFNELLPVVAYVEEENEESARAMEIFKLLEQPEATQEIQLYGETYQLSFEAVTQLKPHVRYKAFKLFDQDQLIVRGLLLFYESHPRHYPTQRLAIRVKKNNIYYSDIRELLGDGEKEWRITKGYYTQYQDNKVLKERAEQAARQHDFDTIDYSYRIGEYQNKSKEFTEDAGIIKARLIQLALIFAAVSGVIQLEPTEPVLLPDDEDEPNEELESNFKLQAIYDQIKTSKLTFSQQIIRDFHLNLTALEDKHFVILSGISGTGKTQLARLYANAVYGLTDSEQNPYLSIIPVHPDWMDSTALFGYYSSFEKDYIVPEFLRMVLKAEKELDKPHFILLDEMNLARVEYYLSDFLSAVESNAEIHLHSREGLDVPGTISLPPNIYIIGTINVDETTYAISDKVLDRAFVMNLSDVDLATFKKNWSNEIAGPMENVFDFLMQFHSDLVEYDLHFGYRTMHEMLLKIERGLHLEGDFKMTWQEAVDRAIGEKVLTKVRGDERIKPLFAVLYELLYTLDGQTYSLNLLQRMEEELDRYGATQFWQ